MPGALNRSASALSEAAYMFRSYRKSTRFLKKMRFSITPCF